MLSFGIKFTIIWTTNYLQYISSSLFVSDASVYASSYLKKMLISSGTVMRRWKPVAVGNRHDIQLYFRVSHLSISNDEKTSVLITNEMINQFKQFWHDNCTNTLLARDLILASICPHVSSNNTYLYSVV